VTGSTHDEWGYRRTVSPEAQATLVGRLVGKIARHRGEICAVEERFCEGELDVLVIAYGFTARSALAAVKMARAEGIAAGLLRLKTLWPFPAEAVQSLAGHSRRMLVAEMNQGQMLREVQRLVPQAQGHNRTDGEVIEPKELFDKIYKISII